MEFIRLLYTSCCSALFGKLKFRLATRPPCRSISSSLHLFEIDSFTLVGTLLGVGNPNFDNDDLLVQKSCSRSCNINHDHFLLFVHYEAVYNPYT
jgi:hypothetical protein